MKTWNVQRLREGQRNDEIMLVHRLEPMVIWYVTIILLIMLLYYRFDYSYVSIHVC